jgi:hypothetical protein
MKTNILNNAKHTDKLIKIAELGKYGINYIINKSQTALDLNSTKGEFLTALKDDIEKTASYLCDSLPIIYSIKEGRVTEIQSLDNTTDAIFGTLLKDNKVTLCTVEFDLSKPTTMKKSDIATVIFENLFNINRKELLTLGKAIEKYETTSDLVEKAVLFPSTILANKLIEKVGQQNKLFSEYRKSLSFKQLEEFNITFNRSGIEDVIQNSTYISSKGIEQTISAHKSFSSAMVEIANGIKNNKFKYIEAVEVDGDADVSKVLKIINQIEALKINTNYKFTLKFRKLGNYSANGLFMQNGFIVAEDLRNTSALLHEIAHFVHMVSHPDNDFINYMIAKLTPRVSMESIESIGGKKEYYLDPKEVLARALEIASLLSSEVGIASFEDWEYGLIKSRSHYEMNEGIYFDFNSFDGETQLEMIELYKFFFDTSFGEVINSNINNFSKIDTNYRRNKKDIVSIFKSINNNVKNEKKALYSMVNGDNIQMIIDNKPYELSLEELTAKMLANLGYAGNHSARAIEEDWARVKEDKAKVCMTLIEAFKEESSNKEYIDFLIQLESLKVFDLLDYSVGLSGFSKISVRTAVRKKIKELFPDGSYKSYVEWSGTCRRNLLELADSTLLNDLDLITSYVKVKPYMANEISKLDGVTFETSMNIGTFMTENMSEKKSFIPKVCFENHDFALELIKNDLTPEILRYVGEKLINNVLFMNSALSLFDGHSLYVAFQYVGEVLRKDVDFMKFWIEKNSELVKFASKATFDSINSKETEKVVEVEVVEKATEIKTKKTKKESKTKKTKTVELDEVNVERFEHILANVTIEEKPHSKTGDILKVFKVSEDLGDDFISFSTYVQKNDIAYYSKFARAFIVKNIDKVAVAGSIYSVVYSSELLEVFASGKLF